MGILIFFLSFGAFVISCEKSKTDRVEEMAALYTLAWNSQDPSQVGDFYPDDAMLVVNGDTSRGKLAVVNFAKTFMRNFPDMRLEMDSLVSDEQHYKYYWSFSGTYEGPYGNGNQVIFSGFEKWSLSSDLMILVSAGTYDEENFRAQLYAKN